MLTTEQWTTIKESPKYQVSTFGRVRNSSGLILKTYTINSGYESIKFTENYARKSHLVHRLVANNFLVRQQNHTEVNHIDCNKHNNTVDNLEWCTGSENKQHAIAAGKFDAIYTTKNTLGKKHKLTCKSKYHNVCWDAARGTWLAVVRQNKINLEPKRFKFEQDAARHVNYILEKYDITDRPRNIISPVECVTTS